MVSIHRIKPWFWWKRKNCRI